MYWEFDELSLFENLLRTKLGVWLRNHEAGETDSGHPTRVFPDPGPMGGETDAETTHLEPTSTRELVDRAKRLADEGRLFEAEEHYARAISRGDDADAINV